MDESPEQQPLEQPHKATPDPNTDFGDEAFDYNAMPQGKMSFGGINEWVFSLMRPKRKGIPTRKQPIHTTPKPSHSPVEYKVIANEVPEGYEVRNGLLFQKKTLAERVRDQLKFPAIKNSQSIISAAALVVFAIGAYILYSELPTRPELVIGILLVTIAGSILVRNQQ